MMKQPMVPRGMGLAMALAVGVAIAALNGLGLVYRHRLAELRTLEGKLAAPASFAVSFGHQWAVADAQGTVTLLNRLGARADSLAETPPPSMTRSLGNPPVAVAADAQEGRIYVADGEGRVHVLGRRLETLSMLSVRGRISGVAALEGGRLAVCYGLSGYGPDYYVSVVDDPLHGIVPEGLRTEFATDLLASGGGGALYATVNSRVGKISPNGDPLWKRVLPQRPAAIAVSGDGAVAVADERGALTVLDAQGERGRRHQASRFPLVRVAFSPDGGFILAADKKGIVFVYDGRGRQLCRLLPRGKGDTVVAFLGVPTAARPSEPADVWVVSSSNTIERIALSAAPALRWAAGFRRAQVAGNLVLVLLFAAAVLAGNARLSEAVRRLLGRLRAGRTAYLLVAPTFGLLLIFSYYPTISALLYSFTKFSLSAPVEFVGLANFREMLHDPYVWVGVENMLIFLGTGLVKTLTVPLLVAELVFWLSSKRLRQILRTCFVVPAVVPGLVVILLWKMIYNPSIGLLNKTLDAAGLSNLTHAWLAEEGLAIWSIVFAGFPWVNVFAFLILLGGLIHINRDIYEAAAIDGISIWGRFWRIDVPLIMAQIKLLVVFVFIGSVQDFTSVLVFTGGGPGQSTYVPALQMFYQTAEGANLGYAAAIGVMLFALVLGATLLNMKLIRTQEG